jgi:hypothetical protein
MRIYLAAAVLLAAVLAAFLGQPPAQAVPYFARKYSTQCSTCHVIPPKLNQNGEDFLARGYRFAGEPDTRRTWPFAVWATQRAQWDLQRDRARSLPNRVEIISGGPVRKTRAFYFVEWLPVSQEVGGDGGRVERHGRFEDLFVSLPVGPAYFTIGQFRQITQVDVSRRLSLSEPLAFSAGLAGPRALSSRLTGLRSFSLSGRAPAVRLSHQWPRGARAGDGWYNLMTMPFSGELVIPLTGRVHRERGFEFELRPKGVLFESYYRHGLSSIGGHAFLGSRRHQLGLVGAYNLGPWFSTAAVGRARERTGRWHSRVSWENELVPWKWAAFGFRIDDRTGPNQPVALLPYVNLEFPVTSYTWRLTAEHRQQSRARQWLLEFGIVF